MPDYLVHHWDKADHAQLMEQTCPQKAALQFTGLLTREPVELMVKDREDGQVMKVTVGITVRVEPLTSEDEGA